MKSTTNISLHEERERISRRAYEIYEKRLETGEYGNALTDWLQAEEEIEQSDSLAGAAPAEPVN